MLVTVFLPWQIVCSIYRKTRRKSGRQDQTLQHDGLRVNEGLGDVFGDPSTNSSEPEPCPVGANVGTELLPWRGGSVQTRNQGLLRVGRGGDSSSSFLEPRPVQPCTSGANVGSRPHNPIFQIHFPAGTNFETESQSWRGRGSEIVRRSSWDSSIGSDISNVSGNQQLIRREPHDAIPISESSSQASSVVDADIAPPTFKNQMRYKAKSIINSKALHVFMTSTITKILDCLELQQGSSLCVITGRPGDGKTSAGFKVLSELEDRGRDVYHVTEPRELAKICLEAQKSKIAILVENICGELTYDEQKWRNWEGVMTDVLKHENGPLLIVTGNNFVVKPWMNRLESIPNVLEIHDITNNFEMSSEDKRGILSALEKKIGLDIPEELRQTICKLQVRYGFPTRCCDYLQDVYRKNPNSHDFFTFTSSSNSELLMAKKLLRSRDFRHFFQKMLVCGGKFDITQITDNDERYEFSTIAKDFEGIFLRTKGPVYIFTSDRVYCLFAFAYWDTDKLFVLENCSLEFLNNKLRLSGTCDYLNISEHDMSTLLARCAKEIRRGNLLLTLSLDIMRSPIFAGMLMKRLVQELGFLDRILHLVDSTHHTSFAFLLSSGQGSEILKIVIQHPDFLLVIARKETIFTDIVFGICDAAASDCLKLLISERFMVDLNMRNRLGQTPPMVTANNKHEGFLKELLSMDIDFNVRDNQMNTILHYICENGLLKPLEVLLQLLHDVNIRAKGGITPLHRACEFNHFDVVTRLIHKGAIVDTAVIHESCKTGNLELVEFLLGKGGNIHGQLENGNTVLHTACGSTLSLKMIKFLIGKGLDVNARNHKDRTPLIIAQDAQSTVIVNYLKGVIEGPEEASSPNADINGEQGGERQEGTVTSFGDLKIGLSSSVSLVP